MSNLSLAIRNFNDRVKQMNQTGSRQLNLNADEARNLHADIFQLLAIIAELQTTNTNSDQVVQVSLDGGGFK
jgi:hypothetical protein